MGLLLALIGLSGAIRPVAQAPARMKEAAKLGFSRAVSPVPRAEKGERLALATAGIGHITDLVAGIAAGRPRKSVPQRDPDAGDRRRMTAE